MSAVMGLAFGQGLAQRGSVEVPLHHAGVELDGPPNTLLVGRRMGRAPVGQLAAGCRAAAPAQQGLAELQDRAEPELAGQRQDVAQLQHVAALEDGACRPSTRKRFSSTGPASLTWRTPEQHRVAKGGAAGQRVTVHAEVAQALAAAGAQAHVGHGGQASARCAAP
jgi:hypothetical protein